MVAGTSAASAPAGGGTRRWRAWRRGGARRSHWALQVHRRGRALVPRGARPEGAGTRAPDNRPLARIGGGDLPPIAVDPKNENTVYSCSGCAVAHGRRRRDVERGPRGAGRRRLPGHVDQPEQHRHPPRRVRPGSCHLRQSRRELEQLVTQPTGAMYHVTTDNAFRTACAAPAGFRVRVRGQPRKRRRDHVPRLAPRRHPGVRRGRADPKNRIWYTGARARTSRCSTGRPARRENVGPLFAPDASGTIYCRNTCARCRSSGRP